MRLIIILLLAATGIQAVERGGTPATEPWCMVPGWLAEIPSGLPPVVIGDAPYGAEPGELADPLLPGDRLPDYGDPREALLVIARQPLEEDGVPTTVERAGKVCKVLVDRLHLIRHLQAAKWSAGGAKALAELGIGGDADSLDRIPGRVLKHLLAGGRAPWVARAVATWLAVEAGGEPPAMGEPASDPFIATCEAMWRRSASRDSLPDAWAWGVEPEFLALYLPYPGIPGPALGTLTAVTDRQFAAIFERAYAQSPAASLPERRRQASAYASEGGEGVKGFIGRVKAAVLDPEFHCGWPFRSSEIAEPGPRSEMVAKLRAQRAAGGPDRVLVDAALVGPLVMDNQGEELLAVMRELRQDSPALAYRALLIAMGAAGRHEHGRPAFALLKDLDHQDPFVIRPPRAALYERAMERSHLLYVSNAFADYDQIHGYPAALRNEPAEVARICSRWWDLPTRLDEERQEMTYRLNNVAWWMATQALAIDGAAAREVVDQMRHLAGRELPDFMLDTVAADLASAGEFPTAVRFQELAVHRKRSDDGDYRLRLEGYRRRQACGTNTEIASPDEERWPNGAVRSSGMRTANHQRVGWWRSFAEDGTLLEEQSWMGDQPHGAVRRFHANGRVREIGIYGEGVKLGRWRIFDEQGVLLAESWWTGQNPSLQTWWSAIWHANGALKESGAWLNGQKEGFWRAWREDGSPVNAGLFEQGEYSGPWRTWTADGQVTERRMGKEVDVGF